MKPSVRETVTAFCPLLRARTAISMSVNTPADTLPALVADLRKSFNAGRTKPLAWRRAQLKALQRLLEENHKAVRTPCSLHRLPTSPMALSGVGGACDRPLVIAHGKFASLV